ncbi:sugar transferase [Cellulomonas sp. PhB150]|uniref:sugar transferase n=1 Tax=Cellulomonas sp. PhB150 TaxID=2485188 RepID=UPI000F99A976|nr:sugar transferase [Cellulomonas sp. PhB150]ROS22968.1 Undecaprenyl-phosphate galactose phosphotransferase WbaP/exopolysaccharide biosynthesis polyprenyl glycosylphosphotransferase [Cellulomonas sp. PhB150]
MQPFERRGTPFNVDGLRRSSAWRSVGVRYAVATALLELVLAALVGYAAVLTTLGADAGLIAAVSGAALFTTLVAACGGYRHERMGDGPAEFQAVLRAAGLVAVVLIVVAYAFDIQIPQLVVFVAVPLTAAVACLFRYGRRRRLHVARRTGAAMRSTIVVGDPSSAARVIHDLAAAPHHGYRIDGVCLPSVDAAQVVADVAVVGALADVVQVVADRAAEVVIITGSSLGGDALRRLSWALGRAGAHMVVAPDIVEVAGPRLSVRPTAGLSLLEVEVDAPRRRLVAKSIIDITLAAIAGLVLLPVVAGAALAVRLSSPGPAFFRQTRVGVDGLPFTIWKLRTMYVDADERRAALLSQNEGAGLLFKLHDDPRVTSVGRFLRKYSLDELPQLWNVARGDMSLVGPRPPLEVEVEAYEDEVHRRLCVKPGLTGLWQVSGRSDLDWEEAVRLDLRYVDNWSVAMDLMIMWKTGRAVLRGAGAY